MAGFVFFVALIASLAEGKNVPSQGLALDPTRLVLRDFGLVRNIDEAPITWVLRPGTEHLYQFNRGENSWILARERCISHGSDLVMIKDKEELDWILSHYPSLPDVSPPSTRQRRILIGMTDYFSPRAWKWVDGSLIDLEFMKWENNEPVNAGGYEDCAYLQVESQTISDIHCEDRLLDPKLYRFICKSSINELRKRNTLAQKQIPLK